MRTLIFSILAAWCSAAAVPLWRDVDRRPALSELGPGGVPAAKPGEAKFPSGPIALLAPDDPAAPEIVALARGLFNDPLLIFQHVRNHIAYEHYYGSKKGSVMTLIERSGNDYDQCSLLVALLKAAGHSPTYVRGVQRIPYLDAIPWLGLTATAFPGQTWTEAWSSWGYGSDPYGGTGWSDLQKKQILAAQLFTSNRGFPGAGNSVNFNRELLLERVWVVVTIAGTNRVLDPSYKPMTQAAPFDLAAAMGYNRAALTTAAGGTAIAPYSVRGIDETAMGSHLADRAAQLVATIKSGGNPHMSVEDTLGRGRIEPATAANLPTATPFPVQGSATGFAAIADNLRARLTVQFNPGTGGAAVTRYLSELAGKRLALAFAGNTGTVYLDDEIVAQATVAGTSVPLRTAITYPGGYADDDLTLDYRKGSNGQTAFALIYGFSPNGQHVRLRQRLLDGYLREARGMAGVTYDTGGNLILNSIPDLTLRRRALTETLNIIGLTWLHHSRLARLVMGDARGVDAPQSHGFGRAAQEQKFNGNPAGYYVDLGQNVSLGFSRDGRLAEKELHFKLGSFFASAFEHGVIEQLQSTPAATSTIRMLQLANRAAADPARDQLFLVNAATVGTVRPLLIGYSAEFLDSMEDDIAFNGTTYFLPENSSYTLNQWTGTGYIASAPNSIGMIISGGLAGGFGSTNSPLDSFLMSNAGLYPGFYTSDGSASGLFSGSPTFNIWDFFAGDPVDMGSGGFTLQSTDLTLGEAEPRGLALRRSYNSHRRDADPVGLGWGWTHSYDLRATVRSAPEAMLGETTPFDAATSIVAAYACADVFSQAAAAKDWGLAALIVGWGVDRMQDNAVAITMGGESLQFIQQPDGTYQPPAKSTLTLTREVGTGDYIMRERLGATYRFAAAAGGRCTAITDIDGKAMSFSYAGGKLAAVTDASARQLTFNYSGARLASVTDNGSPARSVTYLAADGQGNLTGCTDAEGKTWSYISADRRIVETRDPDDRIIVQNDYDTEGRVIRQRNQGLADREYQLYWSGFRNAEATPLGQRTTFLYDARTRPVGRIDGEGNRTSMSYDGQDQLLTLTSPRGHPATYLYDAAFNSIEIADPLGAKTRHVFDILQRCIRTELIDPAYPDPAAPDGNIVDRATTYIYNGGNTTPRPDAVVDPRGVRTEFVYQPTGDPAAGKPAIVTMVSGEGNRVTTFVYDGRGLPARIDTPKQGGGVEQEFFTYGILGDLDSRTDRRGFVTTFTYNARRQPLTATGPGDAPDYASAVTRNFYDNSGNLTLQVDPTGRATRTSYSATGKVTGVESGIYNGNATSPGLVAGEVITVATNSYDRRDWLDYSDGPLAGQRTDMTLDEAGRTERVVDPLGRFVDTAYNADSQLASTTDQLTATTTRTTGQQYDARGNPTVSTDGRTNNSTGIHDAWGEPLNLLNRRGQTYRFTYRENGLPKDIVTPLGKTTTRGYNDRNLLNSVTEPSAQATSLAYDAADRVQTSTDPAGSIAYSYNAAGQPLTVVEGAATLTRTYDPYGRVKTYTDARGNVVSYRYFANGLLKSVTYPGVLVRTVSYAYDSHNRLMTVTDWANRVTNFTYRADSLLTKVTRPNNSTRELFYDLVGQLLKIEERTPTGEAHTLFRMSYDLGGRMEWRFDLPKPSAPASEPLAAMTYDTDNRLLSHAGSTVAHDEDGNMIQGPLPNGTPGSYTYNARNQLTVAGGVTYGYDAEGHRVSLTSGGQTTRYVIDPHGGPLPRVLVRERPTGGGNVLSVHAGATLLYDVEATSDAVTYYHYDQVGSTVALSNAAGAITDRVSYTPYGTTIARTGTADTPFLYVGALGVQTDPNGLHYMRARYYNAKLARFVNADPIGFGGGMNWYAYANGNPVLANDPSGEFANFIIGAVIGVGVQATFDLIRGETSSLGTYLGAAGGGALTGGASAFITSAGRAAVVGAGGAIAGNLTQQSVDMGTGAQTDFSWNSLGVQSVAGGAGGAILQKVLPNALSNLSNQAKGDLGEATSLLNNLVRGNVPAGGAGVGWQVKMSIAGRNPIWDWQFRNVFTGGVTIVESKFGTAGLTSAQRTAAPYVGNLVVERWTYQFWGQAGGVGGGIFGSTLGGLK